jgi:hypothetical protein
MITKEKIELLMLKTEHFENRDIFPPIHPLVISRGLEVELAHSCLVDAVKRTLGREMPLGEIRQTSEGVVLINSPINKGELVITPMGFEFGMAETFRFYKNANWPTRIRLPMEIIREYELVQEKSELLFPNVWDSHNLEGDQRKDFCFNFAIIYGNRIVQRKYNILS